MRCAFERNGYCGCARAPYVRCKPQGCEFVRPVSNADRIRTMTDEELAKFIVDSQFNLIARGCEIMDCPCPVTREEFYADIPVQLKWLKQPHNGGDG